MSLGCMPASCRYMAPGFEASLSLVGSEYRKNKLGPPCKIPHGSSVCQFSRGEAEHHSSSLEICRRSDPKNIHNKLKKIKKKCKYPGEIFLSVDVTQLLTLPLSDFITAPLLFPYSTFVSINCTLLNVKLLQVEQLTPTYTCFLTNKYMICNLHHC